MLVGSSEWLPGKPGQQAVEAEAGTGGRRGEWTVCFDLDAEFVRLVKAGRLESALADEIPVALAQPLARLGWERFDHWQQPKGARGILQRSGNDRHDPLPSLARQPDQVLRLLEG